MARTKQTARKSTGGNAPGRQFAVNRNYLPRYYIYGKRPSRRQRVSKASLTTEIVSASQEGVSSAAQDMVLSTPDLLVIILSQLPHSSLLKAKRVNRKWASVFEFVEIQAALFLQPRPHGSALYVEPCSDILMNNFSTFWPIRGKNKATFSEIFTPNYFHLKDGTQKAIEAPSSQDASEVTVEDTLTPESPRQRSHGDKCPYSQQWRQLLVCRPPIEALELVQEVSIRGGGMKEFRAVIHRPGGLRMGFLYDAVRHWHQVERSSVELLWNRRTGDLIQYRYYVNGPSFKTIEDEPCITIWGRTTVGCGQYGGLTYANHRSGPQVQVMRSGDEEIQYCMSEPKRVDIT